MCAEGESRRVSMGWRGLWVLGQNSMDVERVFGRPLGAGRVPYPRGLLGNGGGSLGVGPPSHI